MIKNSIFSQNLDKFVIQITNLNVMFLIVNIRETVMSNFYKKDDHTELILQNFRSNVILREKKYSQITNANCI